MDLRNRAQYVSRRDFLVYAGAIAGGVAATRVLPGGMQAARAQDAAGGTVTVAHIGDVDNYDPLTDALRGAGATVDEVVAYRTAIVESDAHLDIYRQLLERRIDVVTFTSASAVRAFGAIYGIDQAADLLGHTLVATMGPATGDAAAQAHITPAIQMAGGTTTAFVEAIVTQVRKTGGAKGSEGFEPV